MPVRTDRTRRPTISKSSAAAPDVTSTPRIAAPDGLKATPLVAPRKLKDVSTDLSAISTADKWQVGGKPVKQLKEAEIRL